MLVKTNERTGGLKIGRLVLFSRPIYLLTKDFEHDGIFVPKGFKTDLVSAPWIIKTFLPVKAMAKSAILHDALRRNYKHISVRITDRKFKRYLKEFGVKEPWVTLSYLAVCTNNSRA